MWEEEGRIWELEGWMGGGFCFDFLIFLIARILRGTNVESKLWKMWDLLRMWVWDGVLNWYKTDYRILKAGVLFCFHVLFNSASVSD